MKNFTYIIGLLILVSCSQSKEELLISDYEQTIGNTKTNLNLKFKKVEFVKDIISKDSLEILTKYFNEKKGKKIKQFEEMIKHYENEIVKYEKSIENTNDKDYKKLYQGFIDRYEGNIQRERENIDLYNGDCKGTFLEITYDKINILNTNLDSILCKEYDVIYTINNPMLNNVEQTLTKTYYFSSDISKILKVEKGDD